MRFTSKRPTCETQKSILVRRIHARTRTLKKKKKKAVSQNQKNFILCLHNGFNLWQGESQCQESHDKGWDYSGARSVTHDKHTLEIKVNRSAPMIFPIIDCYVEYHIERRALVFKFSPMRKWACCVRNGSWLTRQRPYVRTGVAPRSQIQLRSYSLLNWRANAGSSPVHALQLPATCT